MTIEKEKIEAIKRDVDLAALVKARGVKLRKNGKSYFGLCPFHGDKNPSFSVNPNQQLMAVLWLRRRRRCDPLYGAVRPGGL